MKKVRIFDTTLRDGEQAPGNAMSLEDKLNIAARIYEIGVDTIEVGFPASSSSDQQAARMIRNELPETRLASFARTTEDDIKVAYDCLGNERHQLQMVATASENHLYYKRHISEEECVDEVRRALEAASKYDFESIAVGLEDVTRGSRELCEKLILAIVEGGADTLILADTTGCALPKAFGELVSDVKSLLPPEMLLSVHAHNDLGLATANAWYGILGGADEVQTTLGGVGERTGNTSLEQICSLIYYYGQDIGIEQSIKMDRISRAVKVLEQCSEYTVPVNAPIIGKYAFSTAAGIHQNALLKSPSTYSFVDPKVYGRDFEFYFSKHSGRSYIRHIADKSELSIDDTETEMVYTTLMKRSKVDHTLNEKNVLTEIEKVLGIKTSFDAQNQHKRDFR